MGVEAFISKIGQEITEIWEKNRTSGNGDS